MNLSEFKEITPQRLNDVGISQIHNGTNISPIKRIQIFSPDEWEEFTEEILEVIKNQKNALYVRRFTGSGDKGIDVALFYDKNFLKGKWDCYQCKHYSSPLIFSEQCIEIGKIIYYSYIQEYKVPASYFFIAPYGCGTGLTFLLSKGKNELKQKVIDSWKQYCQTKITRTKEIPLDTNLKEYIEKFDFSIFKQKTPAELIAIHKQSKHHIHKFGTGLPPRPNISLPPDNISNNELKYVNKLIEAYKEHLKDPRLTLQDVSDYQTLQSHLNRSREEFFSAESLNNFSRDILPDGTFDKLKKEVYNYVENTILDEYKDGLERARKVIDKSHDTPVDSSPLKECIVVRDKAGICHQLANEDVIDWVKK